MNRRLSVRLMPALVSLLSAGWPDASSPATAREPKASVTAAVASDASAISSAAAVTPEGGAPVQAAIDLLHVVPCVVAVSSKVDNPKDFPEHLVDGKNETAWNSKTGDLHGLDGLLGRALGMGAILSSSLSTGTFALAAFVDASLLPRKLRTAAIAAAPSSTPTAIHATG